MRKNDAERVRNSNTREKKEEKEEMKKMRNCNTCLYYESRGFCTIHYTVPGGCNDYRTGYEKNITSDMKEDKYSYSANIVTEITEQAITFENKMMGVALGKWGYCKADIEKALVELEQYRKIGTAEECREAVEKTKPKEPEIIPLKDGTKYLKCPNCKLTTVIYNDMIVGYCPKCGQKLEE